MNKNIATALLCATLILTSTTYSGGVASSMPAHAPIKPIYTEPAHAKELSLEDLARQKVTDSLPTLFQKVVKRNPTLHEQAQYRAIRERVVLQLIFNKVTAANLDLLVSVVLSEALRHVFVDLTSIQLFWYSAPESPVAPDRRRT